MGTHYLFIYLFIFLKVKNHSSNRTLLILFLVEEEKSVEIGGFDYLESPVSDGTIEENFEEELVNAPISGPYSIINPENAFNDDEDEDFSDVSQYGIVEVVGDDTCGRKIITVTACKLPNNSQLDHQRLLRLVIHCSVIG